jgi:hypothetical protein
MEYKLEETKGYREGFADGLNGNFGKEYDLNSLYAQEYDRGFEAGLNEAERFKWANDPKVGD